jgi:hypothetical protein
MQQPYVWWRDNPNYTIDTPIPDSFLPLAGPHGVAIVRSWDDGKTDKGWGLQAKKPDDPTFMEQYKGERFAPKRTLVGYERGAWNFAFIMRSMRLVCIDIDGKNGGLEHAVRLSPFPHTLAETSKSGDGYHLFYVTPDDVWDDELGFGGYSDRIGIEQGVDIRGTGCVYHYPTQRWNGHPIAMLPEHLARRLKQSTQKIQARTAEITTTLLTGEDHEVLMMKEALLDDLKKPIPAGRRNNTLFALGSQMKTAEIENWQDTVHARAIEVGLSSDEADKLVSNIENYGV